MQVLVVVEGGQEVVEGEPEVQAEVEGVALVGSCPLRCYCCCSTRVCDHLMAIP